MRWPLRTCYGCPPTAANYRKYMRGRRKKMYDCHFPVKNQIQPNLRASLTFLRPSIPAN